jgi:hypothetical protein
LRSRFLRRARSETQAYPPWICKRRTTKPVRKKIEQAQPSQRNCTLVRKPAREVLWGTSGAMIEMRNTMSKKNFSRTTKPLSSKPAAKQTNTVYPVKEDDPVAQQQRLGSLPRLLPPGGEARPRPTKAPRVQKLPVAATPPKASPTAATPSVNPPAQAKPPTVLGESTRVAQTPKSETPKTLNVSFVLVKQEAKRVSLCGDFNGWAADAAPMKQRGDGHWETAVALAPGRYQYKFLVDGEWIPDPLAKETVWNQHGTLNSVVEVRR